MNNRKMTLIYDNTGKVWNILWDITEVPAGLQGLVTDVPDKEFTRVSIDMQTLTPIYIFGRCTEDEVTNVQNSNLNHEIRILALEAAIAEIKGEIK